MASVVASSHFPVGSAFRAPSRFSAVWISRIRSAVGAVWPFTLAVFFLPLLLAELLFFFFVEDCAAAEVRAVDTTGAALTRSTAPRRESHVLFVIDSSSLARALFFRSRNCTSEEDRIKLVSTRAPPD